VEWQVAVARKLIVQEVLNGRRARHSQPWRPHGHPPAAAASLAHILSGLSGFRGREVSSGSPPGTAW
jgi:hypothetical protein